MKRIVYFLVALFGIFSCEYHDVSRESLDDGKLPGSWLLVERGYSNGAQYFTEPVAANPAQEVFISDDGSITSTVNELEPFKYYQVLKDTYGNQDNQVLALFKAYPGPNLVDLNSVETSYQIQFIEGSLRLSYRYCFEGCHLGLENKPGHELVFLSSCQFTLISSTSKTKTE